MDNYSKTILIVDDVLENLQLLAQMLINQGYKVKKAINGESALLACESFLPNLILLDIMMPEMDGYEVCQRFKKNPQTQDIPIIFISALGETFNKVKAFEMGGIDYITKPFQEEEVIARINTQVIIQRQKELLKNEIDQRKRIELYLKKMNKQLEKRSLELEATNKELTAFGFSVSHDLKSPLNNIYMLTEILQKSYSHLLDQQGKEFLDLIDYSAKKMGQIIDDLMVLSKLKEKSLNITEVNLVLLVEYIFKQLKSNQPDREAELIIPSYLYAICDQMMLKIALENLVKNAWKYSSKKEKIIIEFGAFMVDNKQNEDDIIYPQSPIFPISKIEINRDHYEQKDGNIIYYIRDYGIGFDIEKAANLFTPFQRFHSDQEFEGTGIGLSIVQRIIHRHGGLIWCESRVNQGTTFYFTLASVN